MKKFYQKEEIPNHLLEYFEEVIPEPTECIVLDPFMGSGTVAVVARDLNRSSVGCELNPEYVKIIKKRLQAGSCLDTGTVKYEFRQV